MTRGGFASIGLVALAMAWQVSQSLNSAALHMCSACSAVGTVTDGNSFHGIIVRMKRGRLNTIECSKKIERNPVAGSVS